MRSLPGGEVGDDPLKLTELRDEVADLITRAVQSDGPERRHFRHVVDRMCRLRDLLELRSQARWEAENAHQGVAAEAAALYELLEIRGATPITDPRPWQLVKVLAAGV